MLTKSLAVSALAWWLGACASAPPAPAPCPACPPCAACTDAPPTPAAATGPLVFDGTPTVPPELAASLQRYLEARAANVAAIAPDGGALFISTRLGSAPQIHRVGHPLGARQQVTFEAEPVSTVEVVPGRPESLVFARDRGGDEQYQIYRTDLDSGKTTLLTDGKSRHEAFRFSPDGSLLVFTSNARNGKDMDLWLGDGVSPAKNRLVVEVAGQWRPLDVAPDNRTLLVQQYVSIADQRLHLVDLETGKVTPLTPPEPATSNRLAVFARDPKRRGASPRAAPTRAYVASDRGGDVVGLYEVELATGTWTSLGPDPWGRSALPAPEGARWDVEDLSLSADGGTLAFVLNTDGFGVLHLLDTATRRERLAPTMWPGIVTGLRFAAAAPVLAFTFSGATINGDAYTYDLRTRRIVRWTESEVGGLDRSAFVEPELFRYKSFDGRDIPCFLYRPRGPGPFPVVVNIHGGPEGQSRPAFSALAQYFVAEAGTAVLVPNVRGSDGYGKGYLALDDGRLREDSVKDIGALLDWIATRPDLDPKRVGVLGGSYGGYMVLAALTHFPDRIAAGVDVVGISSFVTFLEHTAPYRRDLRRAEYGDERDPAMRAFLESISPVANAGKIASALFVVHGANDPRVPLAEAEQIAAAVRANGHEVWKLVALNEGHGFVKRENRDAYLRLTALFFQRFLGGAPTPTP